MSGSLGTLEAGQLVASTVRAWAVFVAWAVLWVPSVVGVVVVVVVVAVVAVVVLWIVGLLAGQVLVDKLL